MTTNTMYRVQVICTIGSSPANFFAIVSPAQKIIEASKLSPIAYSGLSACAVKGRDRRRKCHRSDQSAATPARAQSSSCCAVPPPTPQAPSIAPPRMMGTAPWPMIMWPPSAAAIPAGVGWFARSDSSPLGRPNAADAIALPWLPNALAQIALSMRWNATRRPPASQTETLILMLSSRALAIAAAVTRLASFRSERAGPDRVVHALERHQAAAGVTDRDADPDVEFARLGDRGGGDPVGFFQI